MGSPGQALGFVGGAVLGVIFAPAGAWAAGAAVSGFSYAAIGASLGSILGGLIDPPRPGTARAEHEIRSVLYPTFENDLVVPCLFGTFKISGNVIFIGDTYGRVEDVGTETVGQGKAEQDVTINRTIYYADFVLAFGEGPFRRFGATYVDDVDRSAEEGRLFTYLLGGDDEEIPSIVLRSPTPVVHPVRWKGVAKLVWSGKIGEANHLPSIVTVATGPDLSVVREGVPEDLPSNVVAFMHDDLSDRYVVKTGDMTFASFRRDGSSMISGAAPALDSGPTSIELLVYDGREDLLLLLMSPVGGARWLFFGPLTGTSDAEDWTTVPGVAQGLSAAVSAYVHDDASSALYTAHVTSADVVLVRTDFRTKAQTSFILGMGTSGNLVVRAIAYDAPTKVFHLLYTRSGELRVRRFTLDDIAFAEDQLVSYDWSRPVGIAYVGKLVTVFDAGAEQPIVQFEWGRTLPRYRRGFRYTVADFTPDMIPDLGVWLDAASIAQSDGTSVAAWTNEVGSGREAVNTESGAGEKPVYKTGIVNGKPVVRFDGTNDYLKIVNAGIDRSDVTVFVVHRPDVSGTGHRTLLFAQDEDEAPVHYAALGGTGEEADETNETADEGEVGAVWVSQGGTLVVACSYPAKYGQWSLHTTRFDSEEAKTYVNGDLVGTGPVTQPNEIDMTLWIGRQGTRVGSSYPNAGRYKGDVAEILIFDRALEDHERRKVEGYLQRKYGVEWNAAQPEYLYYGLGDRLTFASPEAFFYAPNLHRLMVLDRSSLGWWIFSFHWNGDNWSYVRRAAYRNVMYEEDSTCPGAVRAVVGDMRIGAGIENRFNDDKGDRVSGFCNAPVDMRQYVNDEVMFAARYQCDYYLASQKSLGTVLKEMLASFSGYFCYEDGKIGVHVERDSGAIDFDYGPDQIVAGSFEKWRIGRDDKNNRVDVEFFDARKNYKARPVPVVAEWERDLYGETRRTTLAAQGCTRARQAVILGRVSLYGFTLRDYACKFRVGAMGLRNTVGDVGYVTNPRHRFQRRKMMIVEMREGEDDEIEITAVDHVPAIHDAEGHPLERPEDAIVTSEGTDKSFSDVYPLERVAVVEDTLEGRLFLLASPASSPGPFRLVRWWVEWDQDETPGATFYPGDIPFSATVYLSLLTTQATTPSGILHASIDADDLSFVLDAVAGEPPESDFDLILVDPAITAVQFGNPNGNGGYERMQGLTYDAATRTVYLSSRGYGTNALAHVVAEFEVKATYVRSGTLTLPPKVKYWDGSVVNSPSASEPLDVDGGEWYLAISTTNFGGASGYPTSFAVTVNYQPGVNNDAESLPDHFYEWKLYYSSGDGAWTEITQFIDGTSGFSRSGEISFTPPAAGLWVATQHWIPPGTQSSTTFPGYGGSNPSTPAARYYLKLVRVKKNAQFFSAIQLEGQPSYYAILRRSAVAYFVDAKTPTYDTVPAEQGYGLRFKPQPVGAHGQTVALDDIQATEVEIMNLSGESAT